MLTRGATGEDRVVGPADLRSAPEAGADTLALSSSPKVDSGREGKMHNQHAGLTGVLSEQRITERQQQATRRWWQLVLRPMGV